MATRGLLENLKEQLDSLKQSMYNIPDQLQLINSSSMVVLNSRDQQGKLWFSQFSHLQQPP